MELSFCETCSQCGTKYIEDQLYFVNGEYYCRRCLWDRFYTKIGGLLYCAFCWEWFMENYPDGFEQIRHIFRNELPTGEDHVEEFVSENLEDYCDFVTEFGNSERLIQFTFGEIRRICNIQVN